MALVSSLQAGSIAAQSAHLVGTLTAYTTTTATAFNTATQVVVGKNGTVYILDDYNSRILEEVPNASGGFTETVLTPGLSNCHGFTVDNNLNIFYVTYSTSGAAYELPYTGFGSGYGVSATSPNTLTSVKPVQTHTILNDAHSLGVDGNGNLFITDYGIPALLEETPIVPGNYSSTTETVVLGSATTPLASLPYSVAADSLGNVYIANYGLSEVVRATPNGSGGFTLTVIIVGGLNHPNGVTVDSNSNVYLYDSGNSRMLKYTPVGSPSTTTTYTQSTVLTGLTNGGYGPSVDPSGNVWNLGQFNSTPPTNPFIKIGTGQVNFGNVNVGSSATQTLNFVFTATSTLGATPVTVTTQGGSATDFALGTTTTSTTCAAAATYTVGNANNVYSCNVPVTFSPSQAGVRNAAVSLVSNNGTVLGTGFITGAGVSPQVNFLPGTESTVTTTTGGAAGIAADGNGNVYIASPTATTITKQSYSAGSYTSSAIGSGLSSPNAVAVDANGDVFVADTGNNRILIETPSGATYSQSTLTTSTLLNPAAVAVDGLDNVYIADTGNNRVLLETLGNNGLYSEVVVALGLGSPAGIAVDGSGNIYIADTTNNRILLETPVGSGFTQTTVTTSYLTNPGALTVDSFGDLFIADVGDNRILREQAPASASPVETTVQSTTLNAPRGIAVSPKGNVYIDDSGNTRVVEEDLSDAPTLTFTAQSGATSYPQTVTLANVGNAALSLVAASSGTNPVVPAGYSIATSATGACPSVTTTAGSLAAGSTCLLPITFTPATAGTFNGSLAITDNNLGAGAPTYATQSIALKGVSTADIETIFWSPTTSIAYGTTLTSLLNAVAEKGPVTIAGSFVYTATLAGGSPVAVTASSVLVPGTYTLTATFTPTDAVAYTVISSTSPLTVTQGQPVVNWASSFTIISGATLGTVLNATATFNGSPVAGTFSYSAKSSAGVVTTVTASTVLAHGNYTITATFTPTITAVYTKVAAITALAVNLPAPSLTWATPAPIVYGTTLGSILTVTAQAGTTSVAGTATYTAQFSAGGAPLAVTSSTILAAGSWTLNVTFTPTLTNTYGVATASVPLTVLQVPSTVTLTSTVSSTIASTLVPLTVVVTSVGVAPTGTVSFYQGANYMGTGTLNQLGNLTCSAGAAATTQVVSTPPSTTTWTCTLMAALADGADNVTAVYSGDSNYSPSTSAVLTISVADFNIVTLNPSLGLSPVGSVTYNFTFNPLNGATFPNVVNFTVTGAPTGAVTTFSPTSLAPGSAYATFTLTVSEVGQGKMKSPLDQWMSKGLAVAVCFVLLPFAGYMRGAGRRYSRQSKTRLLSLFLIVAMGGLSLIGMSGCTATTSDAASQYYLTITASSGSLAHATAVNLNVLTH